MNSIDNPIMTMDDIPEPLTVCSAEEVMTDFDEVSDWSVNSSHCLSVMKAPEE